MDGGGSGVTPAAAGESLSSCSSSDACASSDHYILDRIADPSGPTATTTTTVMGGPTKRPAKPEHMRLKRMRDSSDNFIRLTKPLVVREYKRLYSPSHFTMLCTHAWNNVNLNMKLTPKKRRYGYQTLSFSTFLDIFDGVP